MSETTGLSELQREVEAQIRKADQVRLAGNEAFKAGDIRKALAQYYTAILSLKGLDNKVRQAYPKPSLPLPNGAPTSNNGDSEKIKELTGDEDAEEVPPPASEGPREPPVPALAAPSLGSTAKDDNEHVAAVNRTLSQTYSNMAACHLKLENWKKALDFSQSALKLNEDDTKAKFREAQARIKLGEINKGRQLLEELQSKTDDAGIRNALRQLDIDERNRDSKSKAQFKGMFAKSAKGDEPAIIGSKAALASASTSK